jgi:putative GTP pyrophosphokinase
MLLNESTMKGLVSGSPPQHFCRIIQIMTDPASSIISKTEIDKAGSILAANSSTPKEKGEALLIVDAWRAAHSYPLDTFSSTLSRKTSQYPGVIIAQRLKRLPTIINKLERFPTMRLSRMQDVGGVRAVLNNVKQVTTLANEYLEKGRFTYELIGHKDYITSPKDDGYRGIHLAYKYKNTFADQYNGLLVEIQLRTKLQHSWATAVEAMGTFMGEPFKNGKGSQDWREFFALVSSAFACTEGTPVAPKHSQLKPLGISKAISNLEKKIKALDHIAALTIAARTINKTLSENIKAHHYYSLISLDIANKQVMIRSFAKNQLVEATKLYAELEERNSSFDQVLVSVRSLNTLQTAYPNYFLDIRDFVKNVKAITQELQGREIN